MPYNEMILEERDFRPPVNEAKAIDYGQAFDPLWGFDTVELTLENIDDLMLGKVLVTCCNSEYTVLIRIKSDVKRRD